MSFTVEQRQTLADLGFLARTKLQVSDDERQRLLLLGKAIQANTYMQWTDANRAYIVSLLAAVPEDGAYWRWLVDQFAAELGVSVISVNVAPVGTPTPAPAPTPVPVVTPPDNMEAAVLAILAKNGVFLEGGKVGLGQSPVQDSDARLTIAGGQIVGTNAGNYQNPVSHENTLDICNSDGGIRFIQYGRFWNGQIIRNTLNRAMSVFAIFDSMGDTCISDSRIAKGQAFYIVKDIAQKVIRLCTYQTDYRIEVRESVNVYGDIERRKL